MQRKCGDFASHIEPRLAAGAVQAKLAASARGFKRDAPWPKFLPEADDIFLVSKIRIEGYDAARHGTELKPAKSIWR
jgi:hypothetical protein